MATPTSRVLALPVAADGCPIQYRFNSPSQPACCFRLGLPNRLQGFHYERQIDRLYGQGSEDRACVAAQRITPLFPVLRIPPAVLMRVEIGGCTGVKGHASGCLELLPAAVLTPGLDRVDPVKAHASALGCAFTCVG